MVRVGAGPLSRPPHVEGLRSLFLRNCAGWCERPPSNWGPPSRARFIDQPQGPANPPVFPPPSPGESSWFRKDFRCRRPALARAAGPGSTPCWPLAHKFCLASFNALIEPRQKSSRFWGTFMNRSWKPNQPKGWSPDGGLSSRGWRPGCPSRFNPNTHRRTAMKLIHSLRLSRARSKLGRKVREAPGRPSVSRASLVTEVTRRGFGFGPGKKGQHRTNCYRGAEYVVGLPFLKEVEDRRSARNRGSRRSRRIEGFSPVPGRSARTGKD